MTDKITVVVADDDVLVRAGIEALLETFDHVAVLDSCGSLEELLALVARHSPDVVLTDIRMPPKHEDEGVEAARLLRRSNPGVGVVVLSQFVDPQLALAVLEDGSSGRGYLLKEHVANGEHLMEAIRSVSAGGSFIDTDVLDALVAARTWGPGTELARLTDREREVLNEIAAGHSNGAIAELLSIGERAVEKHISSIFAKLELTDAGDRHKRVSAVLMLLADDR